MQTTVRSVREKTISCRQRIGRLTAQISVLRTQLQQCSGQAMEQTVPENGSYADIEEWIERYYPDRLFLHPRRPGA